MTTTKPPVLTDEEIRSVWASIDQPLLGPALRFARAIEQTVLERAGADALLGQAIEALTMCSDQLLHNGVPTDMAHPRRIALEAADTAIRALKGTPAAACATCKGSGVVPDGEITGSGGVAYENGPVQCVKDCPSCTPAAAVADALPVIPGTPPRIWLVLGDDGDEPANFDELGEVTWCAHPQGPGDIEYVLAAPQPPSASGEREAFEAWAKNYGYQRDELKRDKTGLVSSEYFNINTETTWKAWQARAALAPSPGIDSAEPKPMALEPICYLNPKILGHDGKVDPRPGGALTWSDTPNHGYSMAVYAAPPAAQPSAAWLAEAERLVDAYAKEFAQGGATYARDIHRAALLAHLRTKP